VFRLEAKTGKIGYGDSAARSKNSSGHKSLQSTYADAVKARTPITLISKIKLIRQLFPFMTFLRYSNYFQR
jgi:hypothetical protein